MSKKSISQPDSASQPLKLNKYHRKILTTLASGWEIADDKIEKFYVKIGTIIGGNDIAGIYVSQLLNAQLIAVDRVEFAITYYQITPAGRAAIAPSTSAAAPKVISDYFEDNYHPAPSEPPSATMTETETERPKSDVLSKMSPEAQLKVLRFQQSNLQAKWERLILEADEALNTLRNIEARIAALESGTKSGEEAGR